tara:strand:- start:15023 stop:15484 length:462 start_codon:yes stop_codon:yes gene_type:complete
MHELGMRKGKMPDFERYAYVTLTQRIDQLEDFIAEIFPSGLESPDRAFRVMTASAMYLNHAEQLKKLGYDVGDCDSMRENVWFVQTYLESPDNCSILAALSEKDLTREDRDAFIRELRRQVGKGVRDLPGSLANWRFAHRYAVVAFEDRPWNA